MIEPKYYCPIIPMVLANGMVGIGTDLVLIFHNIILKIIINIKNKLSGIKYKEINPWYKNFTGKIEKISNTKYITKGCYKQIKKNRNY